MVYDINGPLSKLLWKELLIDEGGVIFSSSDQIRSSLHRLKSSNNLVDGVTMVNGDLGASIEAGNDCSIFVTVIKDPSPATPDDTICTSLDSYVSTKTCFVQVSRFDIYVCCCGANPMRV